MLGLKKLLGEEKQTTTARIALWYAFGNVFVRGLAFLSTPVFTRLLSKADYGAFSNFTSWEGILAVIVTLDFTASIARAKYDFGERMDRYLSSILLVSNLVTLAVYLLIEGMRSRFEVLFSMDISYIRLLFLYLLFLPAFNYLQAKHRIYRKYRFFVAFAVSSALLRTGTAVLLVILMQNKLLGRVIGFVVPVSVMNCVLELLILLRGRGFDWKCVRYAAAISIPLIPHALSGIVLGSSDRIMITQLVGEEATAVYTLAYQVSMLANLLWTSMNQAWAPWLYDCIHAEKHAQIRKKSKIYLGVFAVLIVGVLLVTPELMLILGGKAYLEARFVMPPVVMGCVFQFVYGMYVNLEIYTKKTFSISVGSVCAALLNIVLNAIFIPKYGYIAAAYTTLVGYAALFVFHFLLVRISIPALRDLYEKRFIFTVLGSMLVCAGLALPLYACNSLRWTILACYCLLLLAGALRYREELLRLFGAKRLRKQ